MGSRGYSAAADLTYQPGEVILEYGTEGEEGSTSFLARLGPPVVTVDLDSAAIARARVLPNVEAHLGQAEDILAGWDRPVRFAWLDGWDWPYDHHLGEPWLEAQRGRYLARGQDYSKQASQASHLKVAVLLADHVVPGGLVAFDDTWIKDGVTWIQNGAWEGKGGTAAPALLGRGFLLRHAGDIYDGLVLLEAPA